MNDNLDYKLGETGDELVEALPEKNKIKMPYVFKLIIIIYTILLIIFIAIIIIIGLKSKKGDETNSEKKYGPGFFEFYRDNYYINLSYYDKNDEIENTFKKGGENYHEDIGNLNSGKNYKKNERNVFDLYVPEYALNRINETNGVFLWIHGGAWVNGTKEVLGQIVRSFARKGYVTANMGYTLLIPEFNDYNIYRLIDEITACIKAIKNKLLELGFKENKLRMAIGGASSGSHLALLYSYLNKNIDIIPIKFIMNIVGPIGLHEEYFYRINSSNINDTLPSIEEISDIEKAKAEGRIAKLFTGLQILQMLNEFAGNKYSDEDLSSMLTENGTINYNHTKYIQMFKEVKYGYVTEIEDKHKVPTICVYGGNDKVLGVSTYAYLKKKAKEDGRHLDFVYSRYEGHNIVEPKTDNGKKQMEKVDKLIQDYIDKYFS